MVILKWNNKFRKKHGYSDAKDVSIAEMDCLTKHCFRVHNWNHDGHLFCWSREQGGCPDNQEKQK